MQVRYLLIGNGRTSQHLNHYFSLLGISVSVWSRADGLSALCDLAKKASHVLLLISDSAIQSFLNEHRKALSHCVCVHASGAMVVDGAWSAHPLMSFTPILKNGVDLPADSAYSLETYKSIPFILEAEGPDLAELLPGVPNPSYKIPRELKPLYHALCVASGNFTVLLWQEVMKGFEERLRLPHEALVPYLNQITRNLIANPQTALTGPIARGDQNTIEKNLVALKQYPLESLYREFVRLAEHHRRANNKEVQA